MPRNKPNQWNERFLQWKSSNTPPFVGMGFIYLLFLVCIHGKCIGGIYVCALKLSLYGYVQAGQRWVVFTLVLRGGCFPEPGVYLLTRLANELRGLATTTSPPQPLDTAIQLPTPLSLQTGATSVLPRSVFTQVLKILTRGFRLIEQARD